MVKLYAPGQRKGNRFFIARGHVHGRQYEINTRETDKRAAQKHWYRFADEVRRQSISAGTPRTFAEAADLYCSVRNVSKREQQLVEKLKKELGYFLIGQIRPMHVGKAANKLYRGCTNQTKNRAAYTPAASILHFAAENDLRDYIVVKKLKTSAPETRRPAEGVPALLLANTDGAKRLLFLFLFYQGWRIEEALRLKWEHVNLAERTLDAFVKKSGRWKTLHMHDAVFANLTDATRRTDGYVFEWRDRHKVYRWLRPLCERLGVRFTPHMARHEFGGALREKAHATARDLIDVGTWTSETSTARYATAPREHARRLLGKLDFGEKAAPKTGEKAGGKSTAH